MEDTRTWYNVHMRLFLVVIIGSLFFFRLAFASVTNGTISSTNAHAWGENVGWVNLGSSDGNVHVTSNELTGYAWGENVGWISLNCSNTSSCATVDYKVSNTTGGTLSGHAWGENVGWIVFNPSGGGVSINENGMFHGYAWGENTGWIVFNCASTDSCGSVDYKVSTDWRPVCNNGIDDDRDGEIDWPNDQGCTSGSDGTETGETVAVVSSYLPIFPSGEFLVEIAGGASETTTRDVILALRGGTDIAYAEVSEDSQFTIPLRLVYPPLLPRFFARYVLSEKPETKVVYVRFCTSFDRCSQTVSDFITYQPEKQPILEVVKEVVKDILQPLLPPYGEKKGRPPVVPKIESLVPQEKVPVSLQGVWNLIAKNASRFAFAPLPREINFLVSRFPDLAETLVRLGVRRFGDLRKLTGVKLVLPGFSERKGTLPQDVVFVRALGAVDVPVSLTIAERGRFDERAPVLSGSPVQFLVRPAAPVSQIRGILVLKKKAVGFLRSRAAQDLLGFFMREALAASHTEKDSHAFALLEFEYTDADGDGIYTASISAPNVPGEYELLTVVQYQDPALGTQILRLTTVVDPEGYVYESVRGKELRIPGAVVTLYVFDSTLRKYVLWKAKQFFQENPRVTDKTGAYAFLVPDGLYFLLVEAEGYEPYRSEVFTVRGGASVHMNIELELASTWHTFKRHVREPFLRFQKIFLKTPVTNSVFENLRDQFSYDRAENAVLRYSTSVLSYGAALQGAYSDVWHHGQKQVEQTVRIVQSALAHSAQGALGLWEGAYHTTRPLFFDARAVLFSAFQRANMILREL